MPLIFFLTGAVLLLLILSGVYVFVAACVRRKELPWLVKEEIEKTSYAKYYQYMADSDRWIREHHAQDVYIISEDGLRLHGLWIPVHEPRGTVLLAHGYRSTMLLDFGLAFAFYHSMGMNILLPDQRSHGKSEGRYITFGVKESRDVCNWIAWHNKEYSELPMVLSGMSMGATTVLYTADAQLPQNVKCIVADCGFTSPWEIISTVFRRVTHLPAAPSLWITNIIARFLAGFDLKEKDTRQTLKLSRLPVLLIHGTDDNFVPCDMTRDAYASCAEPKHVMYIDGADHGVSFVVSPEKYAATLADFLHTYMGV